MVSPSSELDLTNGAGLSAYLTARSVPHTDIVLLTGGTANYVYRVTSSLTSLSTTSSDINSNPPPQTEARIYKHAAPYLHSNPSFAFDPTRMDYENHVLTSLPNYLPKDAPSSSSEHGGGRKYSVHAVKTYGYDAQERLLCLEDGGERELKKAYADPSLDIAEVGKEVGKWLAKLHDSTKKMSLALEGDSTDENGEKGESKANNAIGVAIYRHSYRNLAAALAEYGYDVELVHRIDEEFGSKLATDNECVCHGDFWPGNVLVRFCSEQGGGVDLTVVDWEISRRGTSATDVGQFAAEAFLLDRFRGGRGLLADFLGAYVEARFGDLEAMGELGEKEWVKRVVVHWAVHVAFWPTRVAWTDREGTRKLVEIGIAVLEAAIDDDWAKLRDCDLFQSAGERFVRWLVDRSA